MRDELKSQIIVIVGPTASGKSDLAVKLAQKYNGEIISADSRQIYRGLDIGSGKITEREMRGIPHYLLDIASPKRTFTVTRYQKLATQAVSKILAKNKLPIIVGGTGFYIDALLYDHKFPEIKPDPQLRKHFDKLSAKTLYERLRKLDPQRAKTIDSKNKRRLVRALEIIITSGKPVPSLSRPKSKYQILKIGINLPEDKLRQKIHLRLLSRIKKGMIKEVQNLKASGLSWQRLDNLGLEYRWVSRYLRNIISKQEMIETLEKEIWHYAKRQMTWFKKDSTIYWLADNKIKISD